MYLHQKEEEGTLKDIYIMIRCTILRINRKKRRGRIDTYLETSSITVSWEPKDAPKVWRGNNFGNFK